MCRCVRVPFVLYLYVFLYAAILHISLLPLQLCIKVLICTGTLVSKALHNNLVAYIRTIIRSKMKEE